MIKKLYTNFKKCKFKYTLFGFALSILCTTIFIIFLIKHNVEIIVLLEFPYLIIVLIALSIAKDLSIKRKKLTKTYFNFQEINQN